MKHRNRLLYEFVDGFVGTALDVLFNQLRKFWPKTNSHKDILVYAARGIPKLNSGRATQAIVIARTLGPPAVGLVRRNFMSPRIPSGKRPWNPTLGPRACAVS